MSEDIARLQVYLEARIDQFERQMKKAENAGKQSTQKIEAAAKNMESKVSDAFARAGKTSAAAMLNSFKGIAPAIGAALSVDAIMTAADGWTNLTNRLRGFGLSAEEAAKAQESIVSIAEKSRTDIASVGELYGKLTLATKSLGFSQAEVVTMTETVTKALKISGASSIEAASATLQLGQALASGKLQGDELRSILENAPMLARFIAQEFGVTIGELKTLGAEGKLAADGVARALVKAAPEIDTAFAKTKATWADTLTSLKNGFVEFIGILKTAVSETQVFATASEDVAQRVKAMRDSSGVTADSKAKAEAYAIASLQRSLANDQAKAKSEADLVRQQISSMISEIQRTGQLYNLGNLNISKENRAKAFDLIQSGLKGSAQAAIEASVALDKLSRTNPDFRTLAAQFELPLQKLAKLEIAADNAGAALSKMATVPAYAAPVGLRGFDKANDASTVDRQEGIARGILDSEIINSKLTEKARSIKKKVENLKSELRKAGAYGFVTDAAIQKAAESILSNESASKGSGGAGVSGFTDELNRSRERIAALQQERSELGEGRYEALASKSAFELMNAAKRDGIPITEAMRQKIEETSAAMAREQIATDDATKALAAQKQMSDFLGQSMSGFFSDVVSGGKNAEDALMNVTKRIAEAALQATILGQGPLASLFGTGSSGGLFGMLSGAFMGGGAYTAGAGGYGGMGPFIPSFANGTDSAPGGLALVGENGPELVNLKAGMQVIPNLDTRRILSGGPVVNVNLTQTFTADANPRELAGIASAIKEQTKAAVFEAIGRGAMGRSR